MHGGMDQGKFVGKTLGEALRAARSGKIGGANPEAAHEASVVEAAMAAIGRPAPAQPQRTESERVEDTRTAGEVAADAAAPEAEHDGGEQAAAQQSTDPSEKKISRARNLLKRAGWQDADFEHFSRDQILRRAEIQEKAEARHAATRAEVARLQKRIQELEAQKPGQGSLQSTSEGTQSRVPPSPVDLDKLAAPFAEIGPDAVSQAKASFQAAFDPLLARLAQLEQRDTKRSAEGAEEARSATRAEAQRQLAELIPEVANDDEFEDFERVSASLRALPQYARADTDPDVAQALVLATARALNFAVVGEHGEPTERQGAARRGLLEPNGRHAPRPPANEPFERTAERNFLRLLEQERRRRGA